MSRYEDPMTAEDRDWQQHHDRCEERDEHRHDQAADAAESALSAGEMFAALCRSYEGLR